MASAGGDRQAARMSDAAVSAKTGKTWPEWFAVLAAEGASSLTHQQIVALLSEKHGVAGWWTQNVTNAYEQHIGRRQRHEMPEGFQISASKTLAVPLPVLYEAWSDETVRGRWLGAARLTVHKATENKSLRIAWPDGKTSVDVNLYAKGEGKSQVTLQHSRLPDAEQAVRLKEFWAVAMERLKDAVEAKSGSISPAPRK